MRRLSLLVMLVALTLVSALALGQGPQAAALPPLVPASEVVTGSGSFSPIVADLEKSLAFYNDLLGAAPPPTTPAWGADPALVNFLGVPGAQVRVGNVRIPGSTLRVEIVDFKDVERKPVQPRLQDPGAVRLILIVRDIDTLLAHLKSRGVPVVTAGGSPVSMNVAGLKGRAVIVKDPDGFFIELRQLDALPETNAPAGSNIVDARFGLTINDTERTMTLYRDLLGFKPEVGGTFVSDKAATDLMASAGAQMRITTAIIPGSRVPVEFVEFKGIDRKPIGARIQDPGATRLQLQVRDVDATVKTLTAAGGTVITTGGNGGPIDMQGLRVAIVRELNNLFLVTFTRGQAPAQRGR
jgi:catechol 2,3-dioxygenase-like lactoylglutathione lyase family enzyme